jgi:hypothetical protein
MSLFDQCQTEKIQNRQIDIVTHTDGDGHILVRGELHDRRLVPTCTIDGRWRQPGSVHHMHICLKVATETLTIASAEARMTQTPHPQCESIATSMTSIAGLRLVPGFSARVRRRLGGPKGCIHLTTLLLAMAPAALQGYWTQNDRDPERRRISKAHLERYLVDTCHVWRRDGDLLAELAQKTGIEMPPYAAAD